MTNPKTEAQRRWRARVKEKQLKAESADVFLTPFFEYDDLIGGGADEALALAGIQVPHLEDDRGPLEFTINDVTVGVDEPFPDTPANSLGRAEIILGCLISAAVEVAHSINSYKREEIKTRIKEIEESDLSDPKEKKAALAEIVRLNKMLDRLDKQVRWTFPQWKVTG